MTVKIIQGDSLAVLRTLRSDCIQCAVTSPPYWGLRNYGGEPRVWGGVLDCAHEFVEQRWYTEKSAAKTSGTAEAFSKAGPANAARLKEARWRSDATCSLCDAWRGQLGLEPTYQEYVAHLVEIFREVRRVLRPDGTLWLNLGDSYSGSGRGGNPENSPHQKQRTNAGSMSVVGRTAREAAVTKLAGDCRTPSGLKPKNLVGIPWRVAFALQEDGWYLRQDNIWAKPNPMPESCIDRTTRSHEYLFHFSKSARYYYDADAIKEPAVTTNRKKRTDGGSDKQRGHGRRHAGFNRRYADSIMNGATPETRNRRSVWFIAPQPFKEAHFATFPPALVEPCILAGSPELGVVLDPFGGSGTVGLVANKLGRHAILIELNPRYVEMAQRRCATVPLPS